MLTIVCYQLVDVCRLQHEVSSKEQLWAKNAELDGRLAKMSERNERLVDDLRDSETAAASAKGWCSPIVNTLHEQI